MAGNIALGIIIVVAIVAGLGALIGSMFSGDNNLFR